MKHTQAITGTMQITDTMYDVWRREFGSQRWEVKQGPLTFEIVDGEWKDGEYVCNLVLRKIEFTEEQYWNLSADQRDLWGGYIEIV
jgi:hypothetical protein